MESTQPSKTALNPDDTVGRCTPNEDQSETGSSGMINRDIIPCPYCNGAGHMNANSGSRQFQMALLRQELIKTCMENDVMQKSYQETIRTLNEKNEQLTKSLDERTQTINELQAKLKDTQRQLLVHENYNNPSSQATMFAKKRKEYQRTVKALSEGATLQEAQNSKGKRGRRIGAKGTPPTYTPDLSKTKEFVADVCGGCGRTDTTIHDIIWKIVVDIGECGAITCYMEKITSVYCDVCRAVTHPATDSIPGTWAGPNLRRIIMNIHGISPTVDGISKLLKFNHNCDMSSSAVSKCLSAISTHIREGTLLTYLPVSEDGSTPHGDTPMVSGSKPPVTIPDTDVTPYTNTQYTTWEGPKPPLLHQMEEEASMAPWVMEDESRYNVGGGANHVRLWCYSLPPWCLFEYVQTGSRLRLKKYSIWR